MARIGCEYCAYAFDEALYAVDLFAQRGAIEDAELKADLEATHARTMREGN